MTDNQKLELVKECIKNEAFKKGHNQSIFIDFIKHLTDIKLLSPLILENYRKTRGSKFKGFFVEFKSDILKSLDLFENMVKRNEKDILENYIETLEITIIEQKNKLKQLNNIGV